MKMVLHLLNVDDGSHHRPTRARSLQVYLYSGDVLGRDARSNGVMAALTECDGSVGAIGHVDVWWEGV